MQLITLVSSSLVVVGFVSAQKAGFQCWDGVSKDHMTKKTALIGDACMSMRHFCKNVDNSYCSADDVTHKRTIVGSQLMSEAQCNRLLSSKQYDDVVCCTTDLCNPLSDAPVDKDTGDSNNDGETTCYVAHQGKSQKSTIKANGGQVCANYKSKCVKEDSELGCTADDVKKNAFKEHSSVSTVAECQDMVSNDMFHDVKCCTGDLCNAPTFLTSQDQKDAVKQIGSDSLSQSMSAGQISSESVKQHAKSDGAKIQTSALAFVAGAFAALLL